MKFELKDDYIELYKLLKIMDLVDSGGEAKLIISQGYVTKNDIVETKKRAKIKKGDIIKVAQAVIEIEGVKTTV